MESISKIKYIQKLLNKKEISCKELTQKYIEAIEKYDGNLNSYVNKTNDIAIDIAQNVDKKIKNGEPLAPLEGIPMSLKDNISTKNINTTCCSKMLQNYKPIYDATVWQIIKKQNGVLLGKNNMDEFAMGSSCETSIFGGARNPHETSHVAGGSSGGGASSVAGNLSVYSLGSDTGGSIRQPASFCGVVGLKPSYGAVSRFGLIAFASSLDQIGPITTSVEDAAIVFDSISKYDEKDSTSVGNKGVLTAENLRNNIKGVKIGVAKEYFNDIRDDVRERIEESIKIYKSLGAEILDISLPMDKYALAVYYILACAEASSNLGRYDGIRYGYRTENYKNIDEMICKTRSEGFGLEVKHRILLGTYVLSSGYYDAYYKKAQKLRGAVINAFNSAFSKCDVILTATSPTTSFKQGYTSSKPIETYKSDLCTVPVNIAGLPAVSIPCGFNKEGLPVGLQLIGNRFEESKILNVAYAFESATRDTLFKSPDMGVNLERDITKTGEED